MSIQHSPFLVRLVPAVLLCCAGGLVPASGAAITYQTRGNVWPWTYGNGALPGVTGPNAITFQGVNDSSFSPPATFPLGRFVVAPLPAGTTATYHDAAFSITLDTSLGGATLRGPNDRAYSSLTLYGVLNGVVNGSNQSSVAAEVREIHPTPMVMIPESAVHPVLDLPFPLAAFRVDAPLPLVPAAIEGGQTLVLAHVAAVPEPRPAAVLLASLAGLALHRVVLRRA